MDVKLFFGFRGWHLGGVANRPELIFSTRMRGALHSHASVFAGNNSAVFSHVLLAMYTGTACSRQRAKLADPLTVAGRYMHSLREGRSGRGQVCSLEALLCPSRAGP